MKNVLIIFLALSLSVSCSRTDDVINQPPASVDEGFVRFTNRDTLVVASSEFKLTPLFSNSIAAAKQYKWISSNKDIAEVDAGSGKILAKKAGLSAIIIEAEDYTTNAVCYVTVGIEYENMVFYMQEVDGVMQIFSKSYATGEISQITFGSSGSTELELTDRNKLVYIRGGISFYQEIGIYVEYLVNPLNKITCWGDSMTSGSGGAGVNYPALLSGFTGLEVGRHGIGGQKSTQIAARQGGVPILISADQDRIPESGGVAITDKSVNVLFNSGNFTGNIKGWIGNIHGKITTDAAGNWTFTRTTPGDAVTVPKGSIFKVDNGDTDKHIVVLWYGRNNYSSTETVLNDIQASIDHLKVLNKKFLVLSVCNGNYANEKKGMPGYNKVLELNRRLQEKYTDNYIDIRSVIVDSYNPDVEIDVRNHADDIPPATLRNDAVHFNANGYTIVARAVYNRMKELGWVE